MSSGSSYVVLIVIAALFLVYLHSKKSKKYSILDLQNSAIDINRNISDAIGSITMIIQSDNQDPTIMQFIDESQQQYQTNMDSIEVIDRILNQIQNAPQEFANVVDLRIEKISRASDAVRGYFSINDAADEIAGASYGVANYLVTKNTDYLFKSKAMMDYLQTYIDNSAGFKGVDDNIKVLRANLDAAVAKIDELITALTTGNLSIKWAVDKSVKCKGYTPKGTDAFYRYTGNTLRWYPTNTIASTWDSNYKSANTFDCTGITLGSDMALNLPVNSSIKCLVNNPKGAGSVYRYDGSSIRWYPTSGIASSWDANWATAKSYDCSDFKVGTDLTANIPTNASVKCSAAGPKDGGAAYRYDGSKLLWYPTPEIASTWDSSWSTARSYDCTGLSLGSNLISNVPTNTSIRCSKYNPIAGDAIYRYVGNGTIRHYPNSNIAWSWEGNWLNAPTYDCTGMQLGTPMTSNIPANISVKCSGYNPRGNGAVYRYDGASIRHYPTSDIAWSWDGNWLNAPTYDCTGIPLGENMAKK